LATSGKLCNKNFGEPVPITPDDVGQIVVGVDTRDSSGRPTGKVVDIGDEEFRRSIYVQVQRSKPLGMLETFDAPLMAPNCEQRAISTNAPQSLLLMNNTFVLQQAEAMAKRIEKEVGSDVAAQFKRAWQLVFCHAPTASQSQAGIAFLGEQATLIAASPPTGGAGQAKDAKDAKAEVPKPTHLALANLCQALVISNGFLYVE